MWLSIHAQAKHRSKSAMADIEAKSLTVKLFEKIFAPTNGTGGGFPFITYNLVFNHLIPTYKQVP